MSSGKYIKEVHVQVHLLYTSSPCTTSDIIFRMRWMCFGLENNLMIFWLTECILSLTRGYVFINPSFPCDDGFSLEWAVRWFQCWRWWAVHNTARKSCYCSTPAILHSVCLTKKTCNPPPPTRIFSYNLSPWVSVLIRVYYLSWPISNIIPSRILTNGRWGTRRDSEAQLFQ